MIISCKLDKTSRTYSIPVYTGSAALAEFHRALSIDVVGFFVTKTELDHYYFRIKDENFFSNIIFIKKEISNFLRTVYNEKIKIKTVWCVQKVLSI